MITTTRQCEECAKARSGDPIAWTYSMPDRGMQISWHVDRARRLVSLHPRAPLLCEPVKLRQWVDHVAAVNPEHLLHIPRQRFAEPGLLVKFEGFSLLIDGNHRAAWALREGRDFLAYELTSEESTRCVFSVGVLQVQETAR